MDIAEALRAKWNKFFSDHERANKAIQDYVDPAAREECGCEPEWDNGYMYVRKCDFCKTRENPVDDPKNAQFMNDASDAWEAFGNNGEPIQPEDCDVDESQFEDDGECHCCQCREE